MAPAILYATQDICPRVALSSWYSRRNVGLSAFSQEGSRRQHQPRTPGANTEAKIESTTARLEGGGKCLQT